MDMVERLKKIYNVSFKKGGKEAIISLGKRPVGRYKKNGEILEVFDDMCLPIQEYVPALLLK